MADVQQAISIEKRLGRGSKALKDLLGRVCADFNRLVTVKRHRIDSPRRALIYNLFLSLTTLFNKPVNIVSGLPIAHLNLFDCRLRCPEDLLQLLHRHYDSYKHEHSGILSLKPFIEHQLILRRCSFCLFRVQDSRTTFFSKISMCPIPLLARRWRGTKTRNCMRKF